MSANHTQMDASTYKALEAEIISLQEGNSERMRMVEKKVQQAIVQMQDSSRGQIQQLSMLRRQTVERLTDASHRVLSAFAMAKDEVSSIDDQMTQLNSAVVEAGNRVSTLLNQAKAQYNSATEMYSEATRQLMLAQTMPDYKKFASEQISDLQIRLTTIGGEGISPEALMATAMNTMNDIFMMDIVVTKKKTEYELQHLEALRLAETILAHIDNVKKGNYADLGDSASELLDMNYWTDGRFKLVEDKVSQLLGRIKEFHYDEGYTLTELKKDFDILQELDRIEKQLVAEGRETYNHSLNRQAQAQTCGDILFDHGYEVVGEGFDRNDRREAYVMRLKRHQSGAEIEVIVNQGSKEGEYDVYFRIDAKTYMDEMTMQTLTSDIAEEFKEAGVHMKLFKQCSAERLETFNPESISVSTEARHRHDIPQRQVHSSIG